MVAMSNIRNLVEFEPSRCQPIDIDLLDTPLNTHIQTYVNCQIFIDNSGPLSLVMIVVWTFTGFRIFAEA